MRVSRSVLVARPVAEVFAYVAEPLNDPDWCPKVLSVEQIEGDGPGAGARYQVIHRPIPLRPPRQMAYVCVGSQVPSALEWREEDGSDTVTVTYSLEDLGSKTRMTQQSDAELGAPRVLHPLMRIGIGHDIGRQLKALKEEAGGLSPTGEPHWRTSQRRALGQMYQRLLGILGRRPIWLDALRGDRFLVWLSGPSHRRNWLKHRRCSRASWATWTRTTRPLVS